MNCKISVIVPVYNVRKYLSKCIESIMNQTYNNLEIILVNDGSLDNCGEICEFYALKDARIKVIHKENGGLSDARNTGLDVATGDYISFIDSDDYIHEMFYEELMNLITENHADIAQCGFLKVYEENSHYENNKNQGFLTKEKVTVLNNIEALNNLYNENYVATVVVWNKLYKRQLFNDIRFPKGKIHEDEFTTFKVLYSSKKVVISSKPLHNYLQRATSIMGEKFNIKRLDALEAYSDQITFFNQNELFNLKNKAIQRLESMIRNLLGKVLKSDIEDKERLFNYLVNYYRDNLHLFRDSSDITGIRKVIMYLFQYSPVLGVKLLCRLLDMRMVIVDRFN